MDLAYAYEMSLSAEKQFEKNSLHYGVIRSQVFPGLWLAVNALLAGDMIKVLEVQQQGLASTEHTAFVQQLSQQF